IKHLFNNSQNICYYYRSHLYSKTIKVLILQICTDHFTITKKYQDILNNLSLNSIIFTAKNQEDNELITTFYINENK
ncbi:uncharacterized protein BO87DRAFT_270675, partial [Aspergillus neoniger CBS 115656]